MKLNLLCFTTAGFGCWRLLALLGMDADDFWPGKKNQWVAWPFSVIFVTGSWTLNGATYAVGKMEGYWFLHIMLHHCKNLLKYLYVLYTLSLHMVNKYNTLWPNWESYCVELWNTQTWTLCWYCTVQRNFPSFLIPYRAKAIPMFKYLAKMHWVHEIKYKYKWEGICFEEQFGGIGSPSNTFSVFSVNTVQSKIKKITNLHQEWEWPFTYLQILNTGI